MKKVMSSILLILIMAAFFYGTSSLQNGRREEERLQLEETLRKTAVACYAAEGFYPPDIAYMEAHYGIKINEKRYMVAYDLIASNLMPDITVLEIEYE